MEKVITCEISFIPLGSKDYNKDVDKVIAIISSYKELEQHVGLMSTTLRGGKDKIFRLIEEIFDKMNDSSKFTIDIKLSNECGC